MVEWNRRWSVTNDIRNRPSSTSPLEASRRVDRNRTSVTAINILSHKMNMSTSHLLNLSKYIHTVSCHLTASLCVYYHHHHPHCHISVNMTTRNILKQFLWRIANVVCWCHVVLHSPRWKSEYSIPGCGWCSNALIGTWRSEVDYKVVYLTVKLFPFSAVQWNVTRCDRRTHTDRHIVRGMSLYGLMKRRPDEDEFWIGQGSRSRYVILSWFCFHRCIRKERNESINTPLSPRHC